MKLKLIIVFCLSVFSVSSQELTQNSASVDFKIKNMGFNVDGFFSDVKIATNFKSNDLENSYIKGVINVTSIDTDIKKRDKHLLTADYFEAETFPFIKLSSKKIERKASNKYLLTASLTIKKTTKTIVIPLEIIESANSIAIKSSFSINRLDYEVGTSSWVLSDIVKIQINYTGNK
ncbi:YceI family protein [Aureibaculum algae]|uniref:YceI family protein n=1 Tax=Aureibaculum algae TaxID=2584122 RepID=A0A5B7TN39_9FLAO|nr:YceI family protein [Aureibaculum algae]QCX37748.1 YceI family protein [Aureibaculum algae]